MSSPWVHPKTGGYWYPKVIPARARHLFDGKGEVRRSLRTRDPAEARARYAQEAAKVEARIASATAPVSSLSHQETVALAGEWYRRKLAELEAEPGSAEHWGRYHEELIDDIRKAVQLEWRLRSRLGQFVPDLSEVRDPADEDIEVTWTAHRARLGRCAKDVFDEVDAIVAEQGLNLGTGTRDRLYEHAIRNAMQIGRVLSDRAEGDYSPDPYLARLPALADRVKEVACPLRSGPP